MPLNHAIVLRLKGLYVLLCNITPTSTLISEFQTLWLVTRFESSHKYKTTPYRKYFSHRNHYKIIVWSWAAVQKTYCLCQERWIIINAPLRTTWGNRAARKGESAIPFVVMMTPSSNHPKQLTFSNFYLALQISKRMRCREGRFWDVAKATQLPLS